MDNNWIIDNLNYAFGVWNDKLTEMWSLLTQSPQAFKGGTIWQTIQTVNGAMQGMLQQTKAAARKAGQRLEQMAQAAGKVIRAGIKAIAAAGGGVVLFLLLALPVMAVAAALSPAGVVADSHTMEPTGEAMEVWERLPDDLSM